MRDSNTKNLTASISMGILCIVIIAASFPARAQIDRRKKNQTSSVIAGKLMAEDGQPMDECGISITTVGRFNGQIYGMQANANGEFVAGSLHQGVYRISAGCKGYVSADSIFDENQSGAVYVPGDNVTIRMIKGGVITGRVSNQQGEPVTGMVVRSIRLRDANDRTRSVPERTRKTDDRGIYRLYGLRPGIYLVRISGDIGDGSVAGLSPYSNIVSAYYPSGSRASAKEIVVFSGGETSGIDITTTAEVGHTVMGSVPDFSSSRQWSIQIVLRQIPLGTIEDTAYVQMDNTGRSFAFTGVNDGDYELTARYYDEGSGLALSKSQLVSVKGADVAGVKLSGPITGFAKGQIIIEKNPAEKPIPTCTSDPIATPENILMTAHMINKAQSLEADYRSTPEAAVDQNGSFTLTTLLPGDYSLDAWLPRDDLFIRSISYPNDKTLAQAAVSKGSTTASFDKLTIKSGDTVQGLSIVIGVGASSVTGMVRTDNNGNSDHARVFLVPAEADTAAQTWRYYETKTDEAGKFTIKHIMPGRYWQIAIPIKDNKPTYGQDIVGRSRLKTDAERKGVQISLSSCQKSTDILLIPPKP